MQHYPVFLDLKGRKVLVIGGGENAERKIRLLLKAYASVHIVASDMTDTIRKQVQAGDLVHVGTEYQKKHLEAARLIVIADAPEALARRIYTAAVTAGIPVNAVDRPELSSCITPAIIDRDPVTIAVSSAGTAPVLARRIRKQIEDMLPAATGALAKWAGAARARVMARVKDGRARLRLWEAVFDGPTAKHALAGRVDEANKSLDTLLESAGNSPEGEVYLVGAGPGDPELLTLKALRLMQQADVVLYDSLVTEAILDQARRDADRILVGKRCDKHTVPQEGINEMLVKLAREGKRVLRLKAGDPYIFGRGGEEVEKLAEAGVPFEVVPGVTAASGCATYAGIPLTHRDHAQSVTFVTGHGKGGKPDLDWRALANTRQTLAVYMGLKNLSYLTKNLRLNGMPASMPAAVIVNGSRPDQAKVVGTIANIADKISKADVDGPALVIIGSVVSLADTCNWFEAAEHHEDVSQISLFG